MEHDAPTRIGTPAPSTARRLPVCPASSRPLQRALVLTFSRFRTSPYYRACIATEYVREESSGWTEAGGGIGRYMLQTPGYRSLMRAYSAGWSPNLSCSLMVQTMTIATSRTQSVPPIAGSLVISLSAPIDVEERMHGTNADKLNANRTDRSQKMHSLHPTIRCLRWIESAGPMSRCPSP